MWFKGANMSCARQDVRDDDVTQATCIYVHCLSLLKSNRTRWGWSGLAKAIYDHRFERIDHRQIAANDAIQRGHCVEGNKKNTILDPSIFRKMPPFLSLSLFFFFSPSSSLSPQPISCHTLTKCTTYVNACVLRCHVAAIMPVSFFLSFFLFSFFLFFASPF
jgi:hypothetical protein